MNDFFEYLAMKKAYQQGRTDAIEEYKDRLCALCLDCPRGIKNKCMEDDICKVGELAKELKGEQEW